MSKSTAPINIWKIAGEQQEQAQDLLAVEEPLEIQLAFGPVESRSQKSISITMRTPGHDFDLAIGFLFTEGIIQSSQQIQGINHLPVSMGNIVVVDIAPEVEIDFKKLERHFYTSSSCGVCGKSSIDALKMTAQPQLPIAQPKISKQLIHQFPQLLREQQAVFDHTGGLHAAALFNNQGQLLLLREDVGRHNAVDKLIGAVSLQAELDFAQSIILVSGRVSFELVQKSLVAGIPMLIALGAPSSLAIQLAEEWGMTIIGFARDGRFNIYCGRQRVS